jgi:hypothetical protein
VVITGKHATVCPRAKPQLSEKLVSDIADDLRRRKIFLKNDETIHYVGQQGEDRCECDLKKLQYAAELSDIQSKDDDLMREAIKSHPLGRTAKATALCRAAGIAEHAGRRALRRLEAQGEYEGFQRKQPRLYRPR